MAQVIPLQQDFELMISKRDEENYVHLWVRKRQEVVNVSLLHGPAGEDSYLHSGGEMDVCVISRQHHHLMVQSSYKTRGRERERDGKIFTVESKTICIPFSRPLSVDEPYSLELFSTPRSADPNLVKTIPVKQSSVVTRLK